MFDLRSNPAANKCKNVRQPVCKQTFIPSSLSGALRRIILSQVDCQIVRLAICQIVKLSDCQIVRLPICEIVRLSICQIARLPDCQIVILSDRHLGWKSFEQTKLVGGKAGKTSNLPEIKMNILRNLLCEDDRRLI